jgi:hypothetical protein
MNRKQLLVILGLEAFIGAGFLVIVCNFKTVIKILRAQTNIFIPILQVIIPVLVLSILLIYLFRDKKNNKPSQSAE